MKGISMKPTCDLFDEFGDKLRVVPPILADFGGKKAFHGKAVTVKCFEDNSRVKELVNTPGNGQVLVIDGGGSQRCALFGDVIAKEAAANGWVGAIVFGCVRDKAALRTIDLGIKAIAAIPRKSTKHNEGRINVPVHIDGVVCNPGDYVIADEDGVLIADFEF
jgi:regulator of ribonuclease activity A